MKHIEIAGSDYSFIGSENDDFYGNLDGFFVDNSGMRNWVFGNLPRNANCLDIGANLGLTAVTVASHCVDGTVYAFEPSPRNLGFLRQNIEQNNIRNISIVEAALGFDEGHVMFSIPNNLGNSTVWRSAVSGENFAKVKLTKLDKWWHENGKPHISFIKIDVEGFETDVIKGGAELIATCRPKMFVEFNSITMIMEARVSPLAFAEAMWSVFDVKALAPDGSEHGVADARLFTFENLTKRGFLEDVFISPKVGITAEQIVAAFPNLAPPPLV